MAPHSTSTDAVELALENAKNFGAACLASLVLYSANSEARCSAGSHAWR